MAGPFPRIPSIPLPPSAGGAKPSAAPARAPSAKERGAVPRIIDSSSERSAPVDTDSDEPTDVMAAAAPERAAATTKAETQRPPTLRAVDPGRASPAAADRRPMARPAAPGPDAAAPLRPTPTQRERPVPPSERREPDPPQAPPPGMSNADVNALYAKYVKAKEILGEEAGPGAYGKLLKTINAQAPKIMEQYNAKGVDFSVVVKDNQVIIRAKPKP
jgi:hypothetical protein